MRVSDKLLFNTITNSLNKNLDILLRLQTKVASGKRINHPSDDPSNSMKVVDYTSILSQTKQYERNINNGMVFLNSTEQAISATNNILVRVKELTVSALNDTIDANSRVMISKEVDQLYNQVVQIANTKVNGRYIFAGFKTDTAPYSTDGTYNGTYPGGDIEIEIDTNSKVPINLPGYKVFGTATYGTDILGTVKSIKTAMENNDTTTLRNLLDDIDKSMDQLSNARAEVGARMNRLDTAKEYLERFKMDVEKYKGDTEEVDIAKIVSDLSMQYNVLDMVRYSASRILHTSILNFLR